jgi:hypothetical protein
MDQRKRAARNTNKGQTLARHGTQVNTCKLTEQDVMDIRETYLHTGISYRKLGKLYGVNHRTICDLVNRITWKHI